MNLKPIQILLVDDDEVDREAVERGFSAIKTPNTITVARNGVEALRILRGSEQTPPLARPFIILLDLNMPQMDGFSVLAQIRADPALHDSAIIALTTSTRDADKAAAYRSGVVAYVPKSSVGEDCADLAALIESYWRVAELPA